MKNPTSIKLYKNVTDGFIGFGSKVAGFTITFDKTIYKMGEKMHITVLCDNLTVSRDLSHVIFELY